MIFDRILLATFSLQLCLSFGRVFGEKVVVIRENMPTRIEYYCFSLCVHFFPYLQKSSITQLKFRKSNTNIYRSSLNDIYKLHIRPFNRRALSWQSWLWYKSKKALKRIKPYVLGCVLKTIRKRLCFFRHFLVQPLPAQQLHRTASTVGIQWVNSIVCEIIANPKNARDYKAV